MRRRRRRFAYNEWLNNGHEWMAAGSIKRWERKKETIAHRHSLLASSSSSERHSSLLPAECWSFKKKTKTRAQLKVYSSLNSQTKEPENKTLSSYLFIYYYQQVACAHDPFFKCPISAAGTHNWCRNTIVQRRLELDYFFPQIIHCRSVVSYQRDETWVVFIFFRVGSAMERVILSGRIGWLRSSLRMNRQSRRTKRDWERE